MSTILKTPTGKVVFSQLEEPRSFKDQEFDDKGNKMPKKYSISVEFEGEDAKKLRSQLIEFGKAVKLVDGKLKVSFNKNDKGDKPRLVDKDKNPIVDRPKFLPKDTLVQIAYMANEFPMGVALVLEAVMVMGDFTAPSSGLKGVKLDESAIVDKEFLDVF